MPIPESQLETWARFHDTEAARNGHRAVRRALEIHRSSEWLSCVDDFLQGSYRNATSVWRDADVDLVLQWTDAWWSDTSQLDEAERQAWDRDFSPSTYTFDSFRGDVIEVLNRQFGRHMIDATGKKAVRVLGDGTNRLHADVLVCFGYRRYTRYQPGDVRYHAGVAFLTQDDGRLVSNFPKQHIDNGQTKNQATGEWYKCAVRQFKNARNRAVEQSLLAEDVAPSYFVECLLYNVPENRFGDSYRANFKDVLDWLSESELGRFTTQNGLEWLFAKDGKQWNQQQAKTLIAALQRLDNEW